MGWVAWLLIWGGCPSFPYPFPVMLFVESSELDCPMRLKRVLGAITGFVCVHWVKDPSREGRGAGDDVAYLGGVLAVRSLLRCRGCELCRVGVGAREWLAYLSRENQTLVVRGGCFYFGWFSDAPFLPGRMGLLRLGFVIFFGSGKARGVGSPDV